MLASYAVSYSTNQGYAKRSVSPPGPLCSPTTPPAAAPDSPPTAAPMTAPAGPPAAPTTPAAQQQTQHAAHSVCAQSEPIRHTVSTGYALGKRCRISSINPLAQCGCSLPASHSTVPTGRLHAALTPFGRLSTTSTEHYMVLAHACIRVNCMAPWGQAVSTACMAHLQGLLQSLRQQRHPGPSCCTDPVLQQQGR
jgi:hypothetical protein